MAKKSLKAPILKVNKSFKVVDFDTVKKARH